MAETSDPAMTAESAVRRGKAQLADDRKVRRAAVGALVGTMLENYDFVIHGTASALVFGRVFFPSISPERA